jgi:hypothetical protein
MEPSKKELAVSAIKAIKLPYLNHMLFCVKLCALAIETPDATVNLVDNGSCWLRGKGSKLFNSVSELMSFVERSTTEEVGGYSLIQFSPKRVMEMTEKPKWLTALELVRMMAPIRKHAGWLPHVRFDSCYGVQDRLLEQLSDPVCGLTHTINCVDAKKFGSSAIDYADNEEVSWDLVQRAWDRVAETLPPSSPEALFEDCLSFLQGAYSMNVECRPNKAGYVLTYQDGALRLFSWRNLNKVIREGRPESIVKDESDVIGELRKGRLVTKEGKVVERNTEVSLDLLKPSVEALRYEYDSRVSHLREKYGVE